jgi:ABC-type polysaccharide/polyol phosphate export permease
MGYLKFVSYLYLVAAAFFIYNAVMQYQAGEDYFISLAFAGLAVFMFFFRRKYAKKFDSRTKL